MKRFPYLLLFPVFMLSPLTGLAQKNIKVSGEYIYHAPKNLSPIQAERIAIQRARLQALADFFGTKMHDITVTTLQSSDGKSDINLQKATESSIKGEWIADERKPEVEFIGYEDGMMVFKARVWGVAREIEEDNIHLDAKLLRNAPDVRNESYEFTDGDDIFVYFQSPIDGYLSIYLVDENRQANLIYPYRHEQGCSALSVKGGKEYYLFSQEMAGDKGLVDEYQIQAVESLAYNDFFILFSTRAFNVCSIQDEKQNRNENRCIPYDTFQHWLAKTRTTDLQMKVVQIPILIKKK